MAFSIPQTINPVYSLPSGDPLNATLNVGAAIKDLPLGTETTMKKTHNAAVIQVQKQFEADTTQFEIDFQAATVKAVAAEKVIGDARKKKIIAITLLVASILTAVGFLAVAIATQTWPILFVAAVGLVAIAPTSYYTHIFRKKVAQLAADIAAPGAMKKPVLNLPVYNPKVDYELQQSRSDAQNTLASMNIKQMHETRISNDDILNYALLDRVVHIKAEKRPVFYAKCVELINAHGKIVNEYNAYRSKAQAEFEKMNTALRHWKSQQNSHIQTQEWALQAHEQNRIYATQQHGTVYTGPSLVNILSRWELDSMRSSVAENYGRRDAQNHSWLTSTMQTIQTTYQQALSHVENQFVVTKAAAVA